MDEYGTKVETLSRWSLKLLQGIIGLRPGLGASITGAKLS